MSQTQRDDLTAGAGDGARPGLITDVLGSEGGEGCWESMRLLRAALFGLEVATLSPQQGGPVPSVAPPPVVAGGPRCQHPAAAPRSTRVTPQPTASLLGDPQPMGGRLGSPSPPHGV